MIYKITNNLVDTNKYTYLYPTTIRSTRGSHNFKYHTYQINTDIFRYSFFPRSIQEWNHLPFHIVNSPTLETFRSRITNHYLPNPNPASLPNPNPYPYANHYPNPIQAPWIIHNPRTLCCLRMALCGTCFRNQKWPCTLYALSLLSPFILLPPQAFLR